MNVDIIYFGKEFARQFKALDSSIQKKAIKQEAIFRKNPLHPSLRLHKLKGKLEGLWSISLDRKYRIIFEVLKDGDILFLSIGSHSIYE